MTTRITRQPAGGRYRELLNRARVVERDPSGAATLVAGTNTDITEEWREW